MKSEFLAGAFTCVSGHCEHFRSIRQCRDVTFDFCVVMEPEGKTITNARKPQSGLSKEEYKKWKKEQRMEAKCKPAVVKIVAPEIVLDGGAAFDDEKKIVFDKIAVNRDDKSRAGDLDAAILPFVGA